MLLPTERHTVLIDGVVEEAAGAAHCPALPRCRKENELCDTHDSITGMIENAHDANKKKELILPSFFQNTTRGALVDRREQKDSLLSCSSRLLVHQHLCTPCPCGGGLAVASCIAS